jgi:hypothetical protein
MYLLESIREFLSPDQSKFITYHGCILPHKANGMLAIMMQRGNHKEEIVNQQ